MTQATTLEELQQKYQPVEGRQKVQERFDMGRAKQAAQEVSQRIGSTPTQSLDKDLGEIYAERAQIETSLANLAKDYGELDVSFKTLLGKDRVYTPGEAFSLFWYDHVSKNREKSTEITIEAAKRKGKDLGVIIDALSRVLDTQHQTAIQGKAFAGQLMVDIVDHMKNLNQYIVDDLRSSIYGTSDLTQAEAEIKKIEGELSEITGVLESYETKIKQAREEGKLEDVTKFTEEMSQVLNMYDAVLDAQVAADQTTVGIRTAILDASHGVQSAKSAFAASKVNYVTATALLGAMSELEIQYRHHKRDFMEVFKQQAALHGQIGQGLELSDLLGQLSDQQQRLMQSNADGVLYLAQRVTDQLMNPTYDPAKAAEIEHQVLDRMNTMNQEKLKWAELQQKVSDLQPGYSMHV